MATSSGFTQEAWERSQEWLAVSQEDCMVVPLDSKGGYAPTNLILVRRGDLRPVEAPSQELRDALKNLVGLLPKPTGKWGE